MKNNGARRDCQCNNRRHDEDERSAAQLGSSASAVEQITPPSAVNLTPRLQTSHSLTECVTRLAYYEMGGNGKSVGAEAPKSYLVKIIMLGIGGVGKSCLTLQFMYEDFVEEYEPTKADSYRKTIALDNEEIILDIMDTAGQEEYASVRDNYLRSGDGFLCVFAVNDRSTFITLPEIREQLLRVQGDKPSVPMILVGNKADLVDSRVVSEDEGLNLALEWGCKYMETSAKTRMNVEDIYYDIMRQVHAEKVQTEGHRKPEKSQKKSKFAKCTCM